MGVYLHRAVAGQLKTAREFFGRQEIKAGLTGAAVFAALYLAVGLGFSRNTFWGLVAWPYWALDWVFWRVDLAALAAFGGVAYYVYRLKLKLLRCDPEKVRQMEKDMESGRDEMLRVWAEQEEAREEWKKRLAAAEAAARDAQSAQKRAEAEAAAAKDAQSKRTAGGSDDGKFREARRAFARLYHPDNVKGQGLDKMIRAEIFKEYWRELETIARSGER
jgi:regulator of protease activity HflC (stomatin/prohibitin superfamily)